MHTACSINKVPIRLTKERWFHIAENHNDLAGLYDEVLSTIENPDFILKGYGDALIGVREVKERQYLNVVYKEIAGKDGFVITAYRTSKIKKEALNGVERGVVAKNHRWNNCRRYRRCRGIG